MIKADFNKRKTELKGSSFTLSMELSMILYGFFEQLSVEQTESIFENARRAYIKVNDENGKEWWL